MNHMQTLEPSIRLNKYLAQQKIASRREADALIEKGLVLVNGKRAHLGDKVTDKDKVVIRGKAKECLYYAYNKPMGVITHSAQDDEEEIVEVDGLPGVYPVGRLDKGSHGLIILTNDGRITERLLSPEYAHEKEYVVKTGHDLRDSFKRNMEAGVDIGGYVTKKCNVKFLGERQFRITLTEGKKHQIRRMVDAMHNEVVDLQRVRVMNIKLGDLGENKNRKIEGAELKQFLTALGL